MSPGMGPDKKRVQGPSDSAQSEAGKDSPLCDSHQVVIGQSGQLTCPFGEDLQRYWDLRHELFTRFDEGIMIDRAGLYSVKPEKPALEIASLCPGNDVLDAFSGIGGSAIAFARAGRRVVSVDTDADRLKMAEHNAGVYGVRGSIQFQEADALDLIRSSTWSSIYLDPAWGGPDYYKKTVFTLSDFSPSGEELLRAGIEQSSCVAITVPLNLDTDELSAFSESITLHDGILGGTVRFRTAFLEGKRGM